MKFAKQSDRQPQQNDDYRSPYFRPALRTWPQLKNGQWLADSIQTRLDEWGGQLFGYHLVKMGGLSESLSMECCSIPHQVNLDFGTCFDSGHANSLNKSVLSTNAISPHIIADAFELPLLEKSIDVVLLAHQLDYCLDPHRLLREVDRIIIDDGYLIITGFNALSLTGAARLLPWRNGFFVNDLAFDEMLEEKRKMPWGGRRWFTPHRIKDWLALLNYQVIDCDCYALFPMQHYQTSWTWLENNLGRWTNHFGCTYFIVARKRTSPLTPIKPSWSFKPRLAAVNASCRRYEK